MIRLLSVLLVLLWQVQAASSAVVQITVKDAGGTTRNFNVTTNSDLTGNLNWQNVICDQSAGTTCASVGTAGSPSTNALTVQGVTLGHGTAANAMRVELPTDGTGVVGLIAGTALVGKVGIDQTTVGTTNGVSLAQIGANTVSAGTGAVGNGSQRVAIGTDTATIAGSAPGTAGTPSTNVVSVQGVASGTVLPSNLTQILSAAPSATNPLWLAEAQPTPTTMQSAAVANGNGTILPVTGFGAALVNINCSVACSGGTTINFEGTDSTGTFFSVAAYPIAGGSSVTTATTTGQFLVPATGLVSIRARISAYSAGTITVTGSPQAGTFPAAASISGSNSAASATASAVPSNASYNGLNVGGNLRGQTGFNFTGASYSAMTDLSSMGGTGIASGCAAALNGFSTTIPSTVCGVFGSYVLNANANGQTTMSASSPVTLASNQSVGDPCTFQTKTNVAISTASGTTALVTGVSAKKVYVCSLSVIAAAGVSVSLAEGSSSTCGTSNQAAVIGVATNGTAANGMSLATNGGLTLGSGAGTVAQTATAANYLCLFQSGTVQLAGNLTYVQQ